MVLVGGGVPAAARRAARLRLPMLPMNTDQVVRDAYFEEGKRIGYKGLVVETVGPTFVHVADDPERAWAEIGKYVLYEAQTYASYQTPGQHSTPGVKAETVEYVAGYLGLNASEVDSIMSFYTLLRRRPDATAVRERAAQLLDSVGLGNHLEAYPTEMSAGEQRRTAGDGRVAAPAQGRAQVAEDEPGEEAVLRPEQDAGAGSAVQRLAVPDRHPLGPVEDGALAVCVGPLPGGVVDLLEHPRHGQHERRPEVLQGGHQVLGVGAVRGRGRSSRASQPSTSGGANTRRARRQ